MAGRERAVGLDRLRAGLRAVALLVADLELDRVRPVVVTHGHVHDLRAAALLGVARDPVDQDRHLALRAPRRRDREGDPRLGVGPRRRDRPGLVPRGGLPDRGPLRAGTRRRRLRVSGPAVVGRLDRVGVDRAVVGQAGVVAGRRSDAAALCERLPVPEHRVSHGGGAVGVDGVPRHGDGGLTVAGLLVGDRRRRRRTGLADRLERVRGARGAVVEGVLGDHGEDLRLVVVQAGHGDARHRGRPSAARAARVADPVPLDGRGLGGRRGPAQRDRAVAPTHQVDRPDDARLRVGRGRGGRVAPVGLADGVHRADLEPVGLAVDEATHVARRGAAPGHLTPVVAHLVVLDRRTVVLGGAPAQRHLLAADGAAGNGSSRRVRDVEHLELEDTLDLPVRRQGVVDVAHQDAEPGGSVHLRSGRQGQLRTGVATGQGLHVEVGLGRHRDDGRLGVRNTGVEVRREVEGAGLPCLHVGHADRAQRRRRGVDDAHGKHGGHAALGAHLQLGGDPDLGAAGRGQLDHRALGLDDAQPVERGPPVGGELEAGRVVGIGRPRVADRRDVDLHPGALRDLQRLGGAAQERPLLADLDRDGQHRDPPVGIVDPAAGRHLEGDGARSLVVLGALDAERVLVGDGGADCPQWAGPDPVLEGELRWAAGGVLDVVVEVDLDRLPGVDLDEGVRVDVRKAVGGGRDVERGRRRTAVGVLHRERHDHRLRATNHGDAATVDLGDHTCRRQHLGDREVLAGPVRVVGGLEHVDLDRVAVVGVPESVEGDRWVVVGLRRPHGDGAAGRRQSVPDLVDDVLGTAGALVGHVDLERADRGQEADASRLLRKLDRHRVPRGDVVVRQDVDRGGPPGLHGERVVDRERRLVSAGGRNRDPGGPERGAAVGVRHLVGEALGAGAARERLVLDGVGAGPDDPAQRRRGADAEHGDGVTIGVDAGPGELQGHRVPRDQPALQRRWFRRLVGPVGRDHGDLDPARGGDTLTVRGEIGDRVGLHVLLVSGGDVPHEVAGDEGLAGRDLRIALRPDRQRAGLLTGHVLHECELAAGRAEVVVERGDRDRGAGPHGDAVLLGDGHVTFRLALGDHDLALDTGPAAVGDLVADDRRVVGELALCRRDPHPPAVHDRHVQLGRILRVGALHGQQPASRVEVVAQDVDQHRLLAADQRGVGHRHGRVRRSLGIADVHADRARGERCVAVRRVVVEEVGVGHAGGERDGALDEVGLGLRPAG